VSQTQFRVLVLEDTVWTNELHIATKSMFIAIALEWYVVAQGETIEQALERVEIMLVTEAAMRKDPRFAHYAPACCAPEEYQRLRNIGTHHRYLDAKWAGPPTPIVRRADIDLTKTKYRVVERRR